MHESDTVPGDFTASSRCRARSAAARSSRITKSSSVPEMRFRAVENCGGAAIRDFGKLRKLISKGSVGPLQGFRSKQGFPFAAIIKMGAEFKPEFDFGNDQNKDGEASAPVDFTGKEPLGKCP